MLRDSAQIELLNPRNRNKFSAKKCTIDGIKFDSRREGERYKMLKLKRDAGQIIKLEIHPKFEIHICGDLICRYIADFSYWTVGGHFSNCREEFVVEDVKSKPTAKLPYFRLKLKLVKAVHGIDVRIIQ